MNVIQALESKIDLIVQELKNMKKNEEVIGRTLIAQNQKIKKLEEKISEGTGGNANTEELEEKFAEKKDLLELKYVIETINPMEFARLDQVQEFVKDEVQRQLANKK